MNLNAVTKEQSEQVRQWRNMDISIYRTPFFLTREMQSSFYDNVICDRSSDHRFFAVMDNNLFVGMVGLVNISFENSNSEISLVINPNRKGQGLGGEAFKLLLNEGFKNINLNNIYGECYSCNPSIKFWQNMINKYKADSVILPKRKYWDGKYHDSIYFNFNREKFNDNI